KKSSTGHGMGNSPPNTPSTGRIYWVIRVSPFQPPSTACKASRVFAENTCGTKNESKVAKELPSFIKTTLCSCMHPAKQFAKSSVTHVSIGNGARFWPSSAILDYEKTRKFGLSC